MRTFSFAYFFKAEYLIAPPTNHLAAALAIAGSSYALLAAVSEAKNRSLARHMFPL